MKQTIFRLFLILSCGTFLAGSASAQPASQPARDRPETRTYDVSDLLRATTDYPLGGNAVQSNTRSTRQQGQNEGQKSPPPVDIASVVSLVKDTVEPESWRDNGGGIGSIRALGTVLVITQNRTTHEQIAALISQLRQDPAVSTIMGVRVFWIALEPTEVAGLYANRKQGAGGVSEMVEVPESLLDKAHLYAMGQTMCFNGQSVSLSAARSKNYISDLTPVVSTNAMGFDPTMSVASSDILLQVTPQLVPSSSGAPSAAIDVQSLVTESNLAEPIAPAVATTAPLTMPRGVTTIDRLNQLTQQFSTTLRVPLRKKILIGGSTLEPISKESASRQLFLVIEVDSVR